MLEIASVTKTFNPGTPNEVRALRDVSLRLERGSFLLIIGTNGSGKSTLLNAVAGTFIADAGRLTLAGRNITRWPEQRQALTLLMASWLKPELLLLDEHTAALDPKSADQVIRLTHGIIQRDKLTTLMVTHSMQQAVHLGDRIVMVHRGQVLHDLQGAE